MPILIDEVMANIEPPSRPEGSPENNVSQRNGKLDGLTKFNQLLCRIQERQARVHAD